MGNEIDVASTYSVDLTDNDSTAGDGAKINQCLVDIASSPTQGTLYLRRGTYNIETPIVPPNGLFNIRIYGEPGDEPALGGTGATPGSILKRITTSQISIVASSSLTPMQNWTFENIIFDGSVNHDMTLGGSHPAIDLYSASNVVFRGCTFRNIQQMGGKGSQNIRFENCTFIGTQPGQVEANKWDPCPTVNYTSGVLQNNYGGPLQPRPGGGIGFRDGSCNIHVENCTFHFVGGAGACYFGESTTASVQNCFVTNCVFRGDWWNNPFVRKRIPANTMSYVYGSEGATSPYAYVRPKLTYDTTAHPIPSGDMSWKQTFQDQNGIANGAVVSFRYEVLSGITVSSIVQNQNKVTLSVKSAQVKIGDVIEWQNGVRAEIIDVDGYSYVDDGSLSIVGTVLTLTSVSAPFGASVAGDAIMVRGGGVGGADLTTTISSKTDSSTVVLAATAGTAVSGAHVTIACNTYYVRGYEAFDTFEPVHYPAVDTTPVRVSRYFASRTFSPKYGTADGNAANIGTVNLGYEPYNPLTGETIIDAGLCPTDLPCAILNNTAYNGIFGTAWRATSIIISGNSIRGSFADSVAFFHADDLIISENYFFASQDCAVGLNQCRRASVSDNIGKNVGSYLVYLGYFGSAGQYRDNPQYGCDGSTVIGNSVKNWGLGAWAIQGTINLRCTSNCVIMGNSFTRDTYGVGAANTTLTHNMPNSYCIGFDRDVAGSQPCDNNIIFGNIDGATSQLANGSRLNTLNIVDSDTSNPARGTKVLDLDISRIHFGDANGSTRLRPITPSLGSIAIRQQMSTTTPGLPPSDSQFYPTPNDGTMILDGSTSSKLYIRSNGTWKYLPLT
jgi:hypothetical protein